MWKQAERSGCGARTEPALSSGSALAVVVGCGRALEQTAREGVASGVLPPCHPPPELVQEARGEGEGFPGLSVLGPP